MGEIWKEIPGYENLYMASNLGRVKSMNRVIPSPRGSGVSNLKGKILSAGLRKDGYRSVVLSKSSKRKTFKVSVLVAMAFLEFKPCGHLLHVNHINKDKRDDRLCNLEVLDPFEHKNKDLDRSGMTSKFPGVHLSKRNNKWVAQITIKGKSHQIGTFTTEEDAALAYIERRKTM